MKTTTVKALQQAKDGILLTVEDLGLSSPNRRNSIKPKVNTEILRKAANYSKELLLPSFAQSDTLSPMRDLQALTQGRRSTIMKGFAKTY